MIELAFLDKTTGLRAVFPALPMEGQITEERPQNTAVFAILGANPQIQAAAVGPHTLTLQLNLWGVDGVAFYDRYIYPSYGFENGFRPHLIKLSWGDSASQTFEGRPFGLAPTQHQLGANPGKIFAVTFDYTLTSTKNQRPLTVNVKTGKVVKPASDSYTAKAGDTLQTVAKRFGVSLEALWLANPGLPMRLPVGKRVVVPK